MRRFPRRTLLLFLLLFSCSRATSAKHADGYETLTLRYEGSAGVVSPIELAEALGYLAPVKLEYVGNNSTGGPHSLQAVVTGDIDIGGSFNGAIVKLVSAKAPLRAVIAAYGTDARNYQGFFVREDSPLASAKDLVGKKVAMNTLGAHAEFSLRELLGREGVSLENAKQVAMIALPAVNCELALREGQVDAAILGNIHRDKALARGGLRSLGSDFALFGAFNAGSYVMSTRFLAQHPKTARKFVEAVGRAIDWSNQHAREDVVARMAEIIAKRKRNEDTSIIQHWKGYGINSPRGRLDPNEFQIWLDWLVRDGQLTRGQIEPNDVFTNEFQPEVASSS